MFQVPVRYRSPVALHAHAGAFAAVGLDAETQSLLESLIEPAWKSVRVVTGVFDPKSANAHDSLGEAYVKANQKDLAIQNYEMALQLDPKNQNAVDQLKKLKDAK